MGLRLIVLGGSIAASLAIKAWAETYDLVGFSRIEVHEGVTLNVTVGPDFDVQAEARRGNLKRLEIDLTGETLEISRDRGRSLLAVGRNDQFIVTVTLPDLREVESTSGATARISGAIEGGFGATASSGATLAVAGPVSGDIAADAASGATLLVENGAFGSVSARVRSGASLTLSGTCAVLEGDSRSGSTLMARDLDCETVTLDARSGASINAQTQAGGSAEAASGASIWVNGWTYDMEPETSGGGTVHLN